MFPAVFNLTSLNGQNGFAITGINANGNLGWSVAGACDFNGDGISDIIMSAPNVNNGVVYVLFGSNQFPATLSLSTLRGNNGFFINGINTNGKLGFVVSGIGDVNNDGIDDIGFSDTSVGKYYIVFGQNGWSTQSFDLTSLNGQNGFVVISSASNKAFSVRSISGGGDVNGDGIADLSLSFNLDFRYTSTIFGSISFPSSINIGTNLNGNNGFNFIDRSNYDNNAGKVINNIDFNKDGISDIAMLLEVQVPSRSTAMYVLYGSVSGFPTSFYSDQINGINGFYGCGGMFGSTTSIANLGDINGDGIEDIGYLGSNVEPMGYIIYGLKGNHPNNFNLMSPNSLWSAFSGIHLPTDPNKVSSNMIGGIGDINSDGIDDFILGSQLNNKNQGQSFVIYGNQAGHSTQFDTSGLNGINGFVVNGVKQGDYSGFAVAGIGDINNDGISDFAVSAINAAVGGNLAGVVYVIYGGQDFMIDPVPDAMLNFSYEE